MATANMTQLEICNSKLIAGLCLDVDHSSSLPGLYLPLSIEAMDLEGHIADDTLELLFSLLENRELYPNSAMPGTTDAHTMDPYDTDVTEESTDDDETTEIDHEASTEVVDWADFVDDDEEELAALLDQFKNQTAQIELKRNTTELHEHEYQAGGPHVEVYYGNEHQEHGQHEHENENENEQQRHERQEHEHYDNEYREERFGEEDRAEEPEELEDDEQPFDIGYTCQYLQDVSVNSIKKFTILQEAFGNLEDLPESLGKAIRNHWTWVQWDVPSSDPSRRRTFKTLPTNMSQVTSADEFDEEQEIVMVIIDLSNQDQNKTADVHCPPAVSASLPSSNSLSGMATIMEDEEFEEVADGEASDENELNSSFEVEELPHEPEAQFSLPAECHRSGSGSSGSDSAENYSTPVSSVFSEVLDFNDAEIAEFTASSADEEQCWQFPERPGAPTPHRASTQHQLSGYQSPLPLRFDVSHTDSASNSEHATAQVDISRWAEPDESAPELEIFPLSEIDEDSQARNEDSMVCNQDSQENLDDRDGNPAVNLSKWAEPDTSAAEDEVFPFSSEFHDGSQIDVDGDNNNSIVATEKHISEAEWFQIAIQSYLPEANSEEGMKTEAEWLQMGIQSYLPEANGEEGMKDVSMLKGEGLGSNGMHGPDEIANSWYEHCISITKGVWRGRWGYGLASW